MNRLSPIHRQRWLVKALCSRRLGLTMGQMAADAAAGWKTILRDLELFLDLGIPLVERTGGFGRKTYQLAPPDDRPPVNFRIDEAVALSLSRRLLEPSAGTLIETDPAQGTAGRLPLVRCNLDDQSR